MGYRKLGNCFTWLEDYTRAQQLMDAQPRLEWVPVLDQMAAELHPIQAEVFGCYQAGYYWGRPQCEWASDLVFRDGRQLRRLYPRLIRHAMTSFGSGEVMRFLVETRKAGSRKTEAAAAKIDRRSGTGRRVRALRPFEEDDSRLPEAINRGEFVISGFRNRDLRNLLYPAPARPRSEQARRSASISRKLRLLRAHRRIHKIPRTHRYPINADLRVVLTTVLAARQTSLHWFNQLLEQAA